TNAYMVRAVKLEGAPVSSGGSSSNPSGSYFNLSSGTRAWIPGLVKNGVASNNNEVDDLKILQTMTGVEIIMHKSSNSYTKLEVCDASGKIIRILDERTLSQGMYRYDLETSA